MVEPMPAAKRPLLSTRRSSQGGIAMSLEMRPPRELLEKIGIKGKEIIKIIKDWDWDIVEPHGLQQQKLYYLPGSKEKGDQAKQNVDFFVGEGELYAYILKQGGLRYLLPDDSDVSDIEPTQPSTVEEEVDENNSVESSTEESDSLSDHSSAETTGEQRKWKRRKKLSTARSKSVEKTLPPKRLQKSKKSSSVDGSTADEQDNIRVDPRIKLEQASYSGIGQQTEFSEYESSWKARGWRAQLLQDMDVHLLRSVAAVDRRHRAVEASNQGHKSSGRPSKGVGPHVQDAAEILQEIEGLKHSIRASHDDLSSMIEAIIAKAERLTIPDRIDPVGRIGIPGFISTGSGTLVLVRDIERYLLLFVAAVRRYQRVRRNFCANEPTDGISQPCNRGVRRTDLRALQLSIEESKSELQELAIVIAAEASKACLEYSQGSTMGATERASQGINSSQSSSGTVRADATES